MLVGDPVQKFFELAVAIEKVALDGGHEEGGVGRLRLQRFFVLDFELPVLETEFVEMGFDGFDVEVDVPALAAAVLFKGSNVELGQLVVSLDELLLVSDELLNGLD